MLCNAWKPRLSELSMPLVRGKRTSQSTVRLFLLTKLKILIKVSKPAIHSLQGALGKTAGRSYKAAPRQLLQVDGSGSSDSAAPHPHGHISKEDAKENAAGAAKEAAKIGREALGGQSDVRHSYSTCLFSRLTF